MPTRQLDLARARECHERAERAERMANDLIAPDLRAEYMALARMWRDLAAEIERLQVERATKH